MSCSDEAGEGEHKFLIQEGRNIIYGLDSDFKRNSFGEISKLLTVCTSITKLYANCEICKTINTACFTHRITDKQEQCIIDSTSYIPVCRKCYVFLNS